MYCDFPLLGRCCFCMPLRRGVLTFGYLNILFSAFMVGVYSYHCHISLSNNPQLVYHGAVSPVPSELCITMYCMEIVFNVVLLYGAHKKILTFVRTFYYYTLATLLASVLIQIVWCSMVKYFAMHVEVIPIFIAGLLIQLYLLILVKSLIKKLEVSGTNSFDNQLNQIVSGERKVEANDVYNDSTVAPV